jgi:hypothetical protein
MNCTTLSLLMRGAAGQLSPGAVARTKFCLPALQTLVGFNFYAYSTVMLLICIPVPVPVLGILKLFFGFGTTSS